MREINRRHILQAGAAGAATLSAPALLFAQGAPTDDFGMAPDGTLYLPSGKTMVKIFPSGQASVFLSDIETENSPAAWVTRDGKWLYWTERAGPAKVKRVALK